MLNNDEYIHSEIVVEIYNSLGHNCEIRHRGTIYCPRCSYNLTSGGLLLGELLLWERVSGGSGLWRCNDRIRYLGGWRPANTEEEFMKLLKLFYVRVPSPTPRQILLDRFSQLEL